MKRVPRATCRIQFNSGFTFAAAEEIADYLSDLGISHLYASPIFLARSGSSHGYDVLDHNRVNPELGGEEAFGRLRRRLRAAGLGWLQDFVPNHMAYDSGNAFLMDVLEKGRDSRYARLFDIDWNNPNAGLRGKILAPFLGGFYGEILESGGIRIEFDGKGFRVRGQGIDFPLSARGWAAVLDPAARNLGEGGGPDPALLSRLKRLIEACADGGPVEVLKPELSGIYLESDSFRRALDKTLKEINGSPGRPESFDRLDRVLSAQFYRLAFWKVGAEELNYRRFFTINELISLRVEEEEVFDAIHQLLFDLVGRGEIDGVRIDHIDGLYDPAGYLRKLAERLDGAWLAVEKILHPGEELPASWPVAGTTGYDFLFFLNNLFCDPAGQRKMTRLLRDFTGVEGDFSSVAVEKKRLIAGRHMAGDIDNLARRAKELLMEDRHGRDITMYGLRRALVEVMVRMPVYRTYPGPKGAAAADVARVDEAIERASSALPPFGREFKVLRNYLLPDPGLVDERRWKMVVDFARRFQQFTGPLTAKGVEDTAFYCYNRLVSLNEVGGDPGRFGVLPDEFHAFLSRRRESRPHSLNASATHDTKRGEDARARINVLSEIPDRWRARVRSWARTNRPLKVKASGRPVPGREEEYFLYQTLLGSWPFFSEDLGGYRRRLKEYLVKALREAKVQTAWIRPDEEYENAYLSFVDRVLDSGPGNRFLADFLPFQREVAWWGIFNSLGQLTVKAAAPGVPDFYQGTELWDFSFVDPDNRSPVDYRLRSDGLRKIRGEWGADRAGLISRLLARPEDGMVKLFLTWRLLQARAANESLFREGGYLPLKTEGKEIFAFARNGSDWAVAAVPLRPSKLVESGGLPIGAEVWEETAIALPEGAPRHWLNAVTGEEAAAREGRLAASEVFAAFPVALLISRE